MKNVPTTRPFTEEETRTFVNAIAYRWNPQTRANEPCICVVPIGVFPADKELTRVVVRDQNNRPHLVTVPVEGAATCPRRAIFEPEDEPRYAVEGGRTVTPPGYNL